MNRGWCLLVPLLALGACSLLHDELPNDPPTVHLARMTCQSPGKASPDTLINSVDAICRVQRGGEVRFEVRAADEDDDPVFYEWRTPVGGSFAIRKPKRPTLGSPPKPSPAPASNLSCRFS